MNRDELIAAAMDAAQNTPNPSRPIFDRDDERGVIAAVDAVEPLIRADERKRVAAGLWPLVEPITSWIAGVNR